MIIKLKTNINIEIPYKSIGLTTFEVEKRLKINGANSITPPKKKHILILFLSHFLNFFNILTMFSGFLSFILYLISPKDRSNVLSIYYFYLMIFQKLILGTVLFFVVILNSSIEFYQQYKSAQILESFKVYFIKIKIIKITKKNLVFSTTKVLDD